MFFKKYPFVFDSLNKRVGYYKTNKIKSVIEDKAEIIETPINIPDTVKESDSINKQKDESIKLNESIKENNNKNNKVNENKNKNEEAKNLIKNETPKESNITDSIFIVIFAVVMSIFLVLIIGIIYECAREKKPRKKRVNELIDEHEYIPKEEQKV